MPDSAAALQILTDSGLRLATERHLGRILHTALDAGLHLTDARCGAFFHAPEPSGEPGGVSPWGAHLGGSFATAPERFPFPDPQPELMRQFFGEGILRHGDIASDAAFGPGTAFAPLAAGSSPVRSYCAVPVRDAHAALLGGMMYGHPDPHVFGEPAEALLASLAAQAGRSMESVRLHERLSREVNRTGEAQQLQRATADRLARVLEHVSDAVFLVDRNWRFTYANPEAERTFSGGRPLLGMTMTSAFPGAAQMFADHYVGVMAGNGPEEFTEFYETLGKWLCIRGYPTPDGLAVFVQDVTERKQQEAALRQSEKLAATGRMAATIAHEINNPLEAVTNLIYLVKTDPTVPAAAQQMLEIADSELARVAQIAQQTLGYYRDRSSPTMLDLNALLRGVTDLFARKMDTKHVDLRLDLEPDLHLYGMGGELRQVFSNLIVNALDAMAVPRPGEPGPRLVVRSRSATSRGVRGASVLICDTGEGIPPAVRGKLFAPFFTTKRDVGTGLGLWVTRSIVEKGGGSIRFRSSTAGVTGTVFRVFLPAAVNNLENGRPPSTVIQ